MTRLLKHKLQSAFTLVEILVGLTIMAMLFVGGYTAYREFQRRQVVNSAATELKTNLNLVRQRALSGEKGSDCIAADKTFVGYEFGITDSTHYYYRPSCTGQAIYSNSTTTITLTQDVTISGTNVPFIFKTIGQGTNLSGNVVLTVTQTASNTSKTVTVKTGGSIE